MREVSCRALTVYERAASVEGLRFEDLVEGLGVPLHVLRDHAEWVDWDVIAAIAQRFERAAGPEASVRAGRAAVKLEVVGPLRRIASIAINLRHLYRAGVSWQLPLLYRHIRARIRADGPRELRIEVSIPAYCLGSSAWLRMLGGGLEGLPHMCGLPAAEVQAEIGEHHAVYSVRLPAQPRALMVTLRSLFKAPARRELERQVAELRAMEREREHVDAALRERDRMLRVLIENLSGMVYRYTYVDGRFAYASEGSLALTGYQVEELVSKGPPYFELVHPDDRPALHRNLAESLAERQPATNEYRLLRCGGQVAHVLDVARGVYDAGGHPTGVEGFITDVTARRRLEEQLSHALRVEGIGRLAGGVAHDFNNLLGVILGAAELALLSLPQDSGSRGHLESICAAAERAGALTRQLLAFANKQPAAPRIANLNTVVQDVEGILRRTLRDDIALELHLAHDLWNVHIDVGQLEQVLLNLTLNARDAMPTGGVLTVETGNIVAEQVSQELPGLLPGTYVMLAVVDTGEGMSEEVQRHLFEPFFTTKERGKGTGLGLASSHGIVTRAHGHIVVRSAPGRGTTFRIYVPAAQGEVERTLAESHEADGALPAGESILVVEDHPLLRGVIASALRTRGYRVVVADSGAQALEWLARSDNRIDLLLTDVIMPKMSGTELAAKLGERSSDVPVLYMSGYSETDALGAHTSPSPSAFLSKPFTPLALSHAVRDLLARSAARRGTTPDGPPLRLVRSNP